MERKIYGKMFSPAIVLRVDLIGAECRLMLALTTVQWKCLRVCKIELEQHQLFICKKEKKKPVTEAQQTFPAVRLCSCWKVKKKKIKKKRKKK